MTRSIRAIVQKNTLRVHKLSVWFWQTSHQTKRKVCLLRFQSFGGSLLVDAGACSARWRQCIDTWRVGQLWPTPPIGECKSES